MAVGLALTLTPVVDDNVAPGDHIYDTLLPLAVKFVDDPVQIATFEPALIVGNAFILTVTVAVLLQLFISVPVTV
jgi:hypothetical protein